MRKEKIHKVAEAVNDDGSVNHETLAKHAAHALEQIKHGHYRIENPSETDLGDGRVQISFIRAETDPDVEAAEPSVE